MDSIFVTKIFWYASRHFSHSCSPWRIIFTNQQKPLIFIEAYIHASRFSHPCNSEVLGVLGWFVYPICSYAHCGITYNSQCRLKSHQYLQPIREPQSLHIFSIIHSQTFFYYKTERPNVYYCNPTRQFSKQCHTNIDDNM